MPAVSVRIFRVQLRGKGDDAEAEVLDEAFARAEHAVTRLGAGHEDLEASATDMASVWQ